MRGFNPQSKFNQGSNPSAWVALATLTLLEIVLGIDNIIFISILVGRLPEAQRQKARILGLGLAMGTRILLLLSLAWVMRLTEPLFTVLGEAISGRDLILLLGGLFLIGKSAHEIHAAVGMADHVPVMVLAIMIAVFIMMFAAKAIGDFVDNHPTIKMLALSFLTLVGFALMAEGMDLHIPKGYIYFAMAFSLTVEMINIRLRSHHDREKLKQE